MSNDYIPFGEEWRKELRKHTKDQIIDLLKNALQLNLRHKDCLRNSNNILNDMIVANQAALIDAYHNGPIAGLKWIYNSLWGPGNLPDINDRWASDANDYYSAHCSRPLGPCEICGRPSRCAGSGHVACGWGHLILAKYKTDYRHQWE
jgi:hypothetical protein